MEIDFRDLVLETLYDQRRQSDSCLTSNSAGIELIAASDTVLPVIESVLTEVVEPLINSDNELEYFPGLAYVIGAYWLISERNYPSGPLDFFNDRSDGLILAAINWIPPFFRRMGGGFNFGKGPYPEMLKFLEKQADSNSQTISGAARRVLSKIGN